ncbi:MULTISPECIES: RidA family protein [Pseudomonas]|uniref:Enamine deaminase RidA, house cleaning of reactive enamine intermediates, YjgF/YER057c/UK114 family n=1 Tax=Pseudomonas panipatensis TaxID=428992 RepID=A0A1G8KSE2_9PSED|nr:MULTISPECIES: RidA family protein [Pseudomonas]SDI46307.1 Enamine deaminase RidA, house cleaning of reactive enamine intermediates, YjgF/YER057c/UK114 family [Pseudomonas panipatensis]SMP70504.1 Enamine deaminase RidA, house cleaning of reactive enamine intermediates, YjgF/YER057c/UK114 family [Pseudomonas panipatensis]
MSNQDLKRQLINPPQTQVLYDTYHFSQANRVGNIVWVSGQVGIDANFAPGADITEQSHLAFQALRNILEEAGGSLADVVELITFHTDLQGEVHAFGQVKDEYFPDRYPAWSAVGVTQLSLPQLRVEVRAVAVIGSGKA